MHARLASRLMMTAEMREAEWLALEAKAKENPLYQKVKHALKRPVVSSQQPLSVAAVPPPVAEDVEKEEEAERAAVEAAEKAAEEAAAALIAEEEAEKAARTCPKKGKQKQQPLSPGRKGKQKQGKHTAAPVAAAPAAALVPCSSAVPSASVESTPAAAEEAPVNVNSLCLPATPSNEHSTSAEAKPDPQPPRASPAPPLKKDERLALITAALLVVGERHSAVLACVPGRAATKAQSAPASRTVSPRPSNASSKLLTLGGSASISPGASFRATSFGGGDVRAPAGELERPVRRWGSASCRTPPQSLGAVLSVTAGPAEPCGKPCGSHVEAASPVAPVAPSGDSSFHRTDAQPRHLDETRETNSDRARETSRRQRREHAAAMGALHALGSAVDAGALRSSIAAAEAHVRTHVHILPALEEELQVARLRLQTLGAQLGADKGAGMGGGLATISEVADHHAAHPSSHPSDAERVWLALPGRTPSVAVPLAELRAATMNFDEAAKVGEGGFASVYRATHLPSISGVKDVAIKKHLKITNATMGAGAWPLATARGTRSTPPQSTLATLGQSLSAVSSANQSPDFADLQQEVALLQRCSHSHLLPLLGHCLERTAPCLIFPLCVGGSLQARLLPSAREHWTSLQRLGFSSVPPPLGWRQRLQVGIGVRTDGLGWPRMASEDL